ncbi:hypothetical protein DL770_006312 [Monosporascus sp. CRB-9-2]|nr:hypothetical protein DL770_006312 [Monosporascus sp. CRB-9-2]
MATDLKAVRDPALRPRVPKARLASPPSGKQSRPGEHAGRGRIPPAALGPGVPCAVSWMQMLLDQSPRLLCKGIDGRWTKSYFDSISYKLATSWLSLRLDSSPPLVHNDTRQGQVLAERFTEETRAIVEQVTGQADPNRRDWESIFTDIYGFERLVAAGAPQGADVTAVSWCFWMGKLMDIHKAIVDRFER